MVFNQTADLQAKNKVLRASPQSEISVFIY